MYGASHQLLSRSGLSGDHDSGIGFGQCSNQIEHLNHFWTLAQNVFEIVLVLHPLPKLANLFEEAPFFDQFLTDNSNRLGLKRLCYVVASPKLHGLNRLFDVSKGSNQNDVSIRIFLPHLARQLKSIDAWHFHVGNDERELFYGELLHPFLTASGGRYFVTLLLVEMTQLLSETI